MTKEWGFLHLDTAHILSAWRFGVLQGMERAALRLEALLHVSQHHSYCPLPLAWCAPLLWGAWA